MTKLNNKKIKYIINQVTKKNQNTKTMAEIYGITRRRRNSSGISAVIVNNYCCSNW